jgi:4-aminobutyrate aminotransferase/(S)-3-amino-2-methylpropionate transaminase
LASIDIKTPIPGPKAQKILARRAKAVTKGVAKATEVVAESASGAVVTDVDGNKLLDLAGGIGMLAAGHCPPAVTKAMQEQAEQLIHLCAIVGTYEPYIELAELLNEVTPGDHEKKTLLSNSGSEAVENAVKIARCHTGKSGVIVFEGAYHGRTLLTLSMTSKYGLFKKGFGPYPGEIYRLPAPNVYRRPAEMTEDEYVAWSCAKLEEALISQIDPCDLAAIVIEPVQGEAGFIPMPKPFLQKIRDICTQDGAVMIADEIQCGMGRTGKLFACEHYGIVPDLITTAKSLGSGMPISALTGRADIMDAPHAGGVGGTYGGSPLACRAAIESIKMINTPNFLGHVNELGRIFNETLNRWKLDYELVGDVRGLGAMQLVEFVKNSTTKEPAPDQTLAIIKQAVSAGVILIRAGLFSNGIRFMPPLVITADQLREALGQIETALAANSPRRHPITTVKPMTMAGA